MWNTKKSLEAFFSAITLALASVSTSLSAFAEEIETTSTVTEPSTAIQTTAVTETADNSAETDIQLNEEDMQKLLLENVDKEIEKELSKL